MEYAAQWNGSSAITSNNVFLADNKLVDLTLAPLIGFDVSIRLLEPLD